jgi:hypothetical protein
MDLRSDIEVWLKKISKEDTSLKTALDEVRALYETPLVPPKPKRRKKDVRSCRRYQREYKGARREEVADAKRRQEGTLRGQFHKLRRAILTRSRGACNDWDLTLAEWCEMWMSCPMVEDGYNHKVPAYMKRGLYKDDVQLRRIDPTKSWNINNLTIIKGGKLLYPNRGV